MAQAEFKRASRSLIPASGVTGDRVMNREGADLGKIEDLMIDLERGRIAYAVLSFGGFLGLRDNLFAIPWETLALDPIRKLFILDINKELLKKAPGFDKDNWPDMNDPTWGAQLDSYYGRRLYWE